MTGREQGSRERVQTAEELIAVDPSRMTMGMTQVLLLLEERDRLRAVLYDLLDRQHDYPTHLDRAGEWRAAFVRARKALNPREECGFCHGQPVGDAAEWLDGQPRPAAPCPRCGVTTPYPESPR